MNATSTTPSNKDINVPRAQWKKLWNWCRKHSINGKVNVRVYRSSDYSVKADLDYTRMGRAVPTVRRVYWFDGALNRNVLLQSGISWSYVY